MWIYFLIFFVALYGMSNPNNDRSTTYLVLFLTFLAFFVGLGDMLGGYDRYIYTDLFDDVFNCRIKDVPIYRMPIWGYEKEFGYVYLNYAISFITANRYIFVLIITCLFYIMIFLSFKEYMDSYPIAIILFLALMFFFTFTYLREITGVCLAWFGMRYAYHRKPLLFTVFAFAAFACHNSAIVFVPFFFLPAYKLPKGYVIIVMIIIFFIGLTPFPTSLFTSFSDVMDDDGRSADYQGDFDAGTFRYEYLIEAALFLYIILKNYDKIPDTKKNIMLLNAALVFCAIVTFFVRSSNGGRLGWYYMAGVIATITTILTHEDVNQNLKKYIMIGCLFLFGRIVVTWGILLSPYKTFLTDGHREGDPIFAKFEYDQHYDEDKFYRPAFILFKKKEELEREGW